MFSSIYSYELKHWLKSPAPYIYFTAFFSISFLAFAGNAGFFDPPTESDKLQRVINSPHEINYMMQYFNKFFLFLLPAIIGATLYKDYKHQVHSILYSFPIKKADYLFGKFLSAFTIVVLINTSCGLAILLAEHLPGLDPKKLGEFNFGGYLHSYLAFTIPNMLMYGAIVFSVVVWFRNIYTGFATIILFFFIQTIAQNAFDGNGELIALFDPFGQNTTQFITHLWTLEEQNTKMIPFIGPVLYNRLFWLAISAVIFIITYRKFSFSENAPTSFRLKTKGKRVVKNNFQSTRNISLSPVSQSFNLASQLKSCWRLSNIQLSYIIKSWAFIGLSFLGILAVLFTLARVINFEEMAMLPVTRIVLSVPAFFFTGIAIMITFIYAGMLMQRERVAEMNQLVDSTPVPNWVLMFSKVMALVKMQAVLLMIMVVAGITIQLYNGYYQLELDMYFFHLFVVIFIVLIIWAFTSVLVHTVVPNLYIGLFVLVLGWIGFGGLPQAGIDTKLLLFNQPPDLLGSDLNGYGNTLAPYFLIEGYWFVFSAILLVLAYLFWTRGLPENLRERINIAKARFTKPVAGIAAGLIVIFSITGFSIHKHESEAVNLSNSDQNHILKAFEKEFGQYADIPQPRITDVQLKLDLYPESNDFEATGSYTLVNKTSEPIQQLLVKTGFDEMTDFEISIANELVSYDSVMQFSVLQLDQTLNSGDSLTLSFAIKNKPNSFFERNSNVLANGTFLGSDALPRLGYSFSFDKKHPSDSLARLNSYAAEDADLVSLETTISTVSGQTALAPGYLQKEWSEDGRHYFRYQTDQKIKFVFGFNSARYEQMQDSWEDINLQVYYHKGHEHNITKMLAGLKGALAYNTKYLSPYQHKESRIIEFPMTEGSYATTIANSIPTSEMRFIANTNDDEGRVDQSFYVAAHELTHQWWGNQVAPADALGAVMISESITEYFSLRIYEAHFGKQKADKFLRLQRERYLRGRTTEQNEEPPLQFVAQAQQYISYGKGGFTFNALMHYLGEERLNGIFRSFLEKHRFQEAPYPTSLDFVSHLKQATPDSLQYLVTDMFEKVVFYDNELTEAKVTDSANGKYELSLNFNISKQELKGKETINTALEDYVQIGFFNEDDQLIYLHTQKVTETKNMLRLLLDENPAKAVLDPHLTLMDKDIDDQEIRF
ncbi:MAG: M1 family aminopeptidase [Roseivirga sp.]